MLGEAAEYDRRTQHTYDIAFYVAQSWTVAGPVLELTCGTGRITHVIAGMGKRIVGVDKSPAMLEGARLRSRDLAHPPRYVLGDCLDLRLREKFELILIPFNSIHHFTTKKEIEKLFGVVREHLAPGGHLVFDAYNPLAFSWTGKDLAQDPRAPLRTMRIDWYRAPESRGAHAVIHEFFPLEAEEVLRNNGLSIAQKWGDFKFKPFRQDDVFQVFKCRALPKRPRRPAARRVA